MTTRVCIDCKKELPLDEEHFQGIWTADKKYLKHHCRQCGYVRKKKYRAAKIDHYRAVEAARMRRRMKDPVFKDRQRTLARKRYIDNPTPTLEANKRWMLANKKRYDDSKREWERRSYKTDPCFKLRRLHRQRIREALNGKIKSSSSLSFLGCSLEELKRHIESQFQTGMTWENHGNFTDNGMTTWHIDHIVPLSSFDLTNVEQQKIAFHYTNMRPLWAKDNLVKGAKHNASSIQ